MTLKNLSQVNSAQNLLTPKQAALFASEYLGKKVSNSNISYLINYGKIANHSKNPKESLIDKEELKNYYDFLAQNNARFLSQSIKKQKLQSISTDYTPTRANLSHSLWSIF